jgi:hypothetical protein
MSDSSSDSGASQSDAMWTSESSIPSCSSHDASTCDTESSSVAPFLFVIVILGLWYNNTNKPDNTESQPPPTKPVVTVSEAFQYVIPRLLESYSHYHPVRATLTNSEDEERARTQIDGTLATSEPRTVVLPCRLRKAYSDSLEVAWDFSMPAAAAPIVMYGLGMNHLPHTGEHRLLIANVPSSITRNLNERTRLQLEAQVRWTWVRWNPERPPQLALELSNGKILRDR